MLRRFGPVILLLPPALLLFFVETLPTTERIDALAVVVVALGVFLLAMLATIVRVLDETKVEASTAAAQAERARIGLVDVPESIEMLQLASVRVKEASPGMQAQSGAPPGGSVVAVLYGSVSRSGSRDFSTGSRR